MIDPVLFEEVTLEGRSVRLEPLTSDHRQGLCQAIRDGELWKLFVTLVPHPDDIAAFFDHADELYASGDGLVFATIDQATNRIVGSTRFMKAVVSHRRVEIGFTFLASSYQRTSINTEAKLLMLTHAFEALKLNRVEFLTDYLNTTSRNAILRLGAKQEGLLRSDMVMPDGRVRDSVLFSITNNEWRGAKQNLTHKLARLL